MRKSVYIFWIAFLIVPFVLLTDMFPFLRFAMFAEPVRYAAQSEIFLVTYTDAGNNVKQFNPEDFELQEETFQYLARNYFYRFQSTQFLEKLKSVEKQKYHNWKFLKITFSTDNPARRDTTLISSIK